MSDAYCAEVKQGRCPGQQQQANQQKKPGEKPDGQIPQQPPLRHLSTLHCEQSQLDGGKTADPTCLTTTNKEDQGVKKRQYGHCQDGEGEEGDCSPSTLLTLSNHQQESNTDQQRGHIIMTESIQEHI